MSEEREFVMARLAAARGHVSSAAEAVDGCITMFLYPMEDKNGSERAEALDVASSAAGELSRAIELAQTCLDGLNKKQLSEEEPDLDEEELDDEGGKSSAEG
jgi:hypothetical protein